MTKRISPVLRFLFLIVFVAASSTPCAVYAADDTPEAFIKSIYSQYSGAPVKAPGIPLDNDVTIRRYFEPSLARLMIDARANAQPSDVPTLDGDPFVDAQEWSITTFDASIHHEGPDNARATVRFKNNIKPVEIHLTLVHLDQGWRISDIVWPGTEGTLRGLYKPK